MIIKGILKRYIKKISRIFALYSQQKKDNHMKTNDFSK